MNRPPAIVAAACCFPSGPTLELAATAVRSQLALVQRHPVYLDRAGHPAKVSRFPDETPFDVLRWCRLAETALDELAEQIAQRRPPCLLWLVLPDPARRPGLPADLAERLEATARQSAFPWQRIERVQGGHAAGMVAVARASAALTEQPDALAVVLAAEAGLDAESLCWLDLQSLLHGAHQPAKAGFRPQPYGRVPGEGAAALALALPADPKEGWAALLGCATAEEPITRTDTAPCTGEGQSRAARAALEAAERYAAPSIDAMTVDLNGEPYRADQFGFTAMRLNRHLRPDWQRHLPALASGDLGSASAVAHLALAAHALRRTPHSGQHLVLASSDDTLRGAALLGALQPPPDLPEVRPWRSPLTSTN